MDENQTGGAAATGEGKNNFLPMVAGFLALIVVAIIAFVVMTKQTVAPTATQPAVGEQPAGLTPESIPVGENDAAATAISVQGTSDEVSAIQADLNATDLKVLDGVNHI